MTDWPRFAAALSALRPDRAAFERFSGISHARLHAAYSGKPLGTDIFIRICVTVGLDPRDYWREG